MPAKIVQVTREETDGKVLFVPARLEIRKGEQIKFVLRNNGELEHEFVSASSADNLKHAEEMKKRPDMAHEEPNGQQLARWAAEPRRSVVRCRRSVAAHRPPPFRHDVNKMSA